MKTTLTILGLAMLAAPLAGCYVAPAPIYHPAYYQAAPPPPPRPVVIVAPPPPPRPIIIVGAPPPRVWIPGHYGPYGGWIPGHWR